LHVLTKIKTEEHDMGGFTGKILRVNLTAGTTSVEPLDEAVARQYIGGRGLGTKLFVDEVDPQVDPFSPENKLIMATGPLTGTATPTGGRYMVVTKSPLTGTIASSNSGGYWGAELKLAGYDAVIFEGRSDKPVYLAIVDDQVELRDASDLWGKLTSETTHALEAVMPAKSRVLCIGPAGEKLSHIAAVMNDVSRAAGRSGVGAVMGSKNLKAIAVRGTGKVKIADEDQLKAVVKASNQKIKDHGVTGTGLPAYGTAILVNIINENGVFPTNNFQSSQFAPAEQISGETLAEKYLVRKDPCYRCPIACGRYCKVDDIEGGGPEYETIWAFGASCGISDLPSVIKANYWCNEYGLDTISAGATIAAAMELYQRGMIKDEDLDGVSLEFGNPDSIIQWTQRMGRREGLGDPMAEGSYRFADRYGMPELSMSVKKQELPAYDPRAIQGQGLQYATSNRGGCHVRGYLISPEILGVPVKLDRLTIEGKAEWTKLYQDLTAVIDSSGLCLFTSFALGAPDYAALLSAAIGTEWSGDDVLEIGDRIWNLERLFNLAAGIDPSQDTLPKRLLEDPIVAGPSQGHITQLADMLPTYYDLRGWGKDGIPTAEKKAALGL
jgi:aldehyde:ferredoxin oxidoreductase